MGFEVGTGPAVVTRMFALLYVRLLIPSPPLPLPLPLPSSSPLLPLQVIFKSCKLIPVMFGSVLIQGG